MSTLLRSWLVQCTCCLVISVTSRCQYIWSTIYLTLRNWGCDDRTIRMISHSIRYSTG